MDIDPLVVIEYIKSSIEILLSLKLEEQSKSREGAEPHPFKADHSSIADFFSNQSSYRMEPPKEYEQQLQKLEGDIRNHIKVSASFEVATMTLSVTFGANLTAQIEQQLKIHLDNVL